jgi:hypothetical protein
MELKPFLHEAEIALEDDFKLTLSIDYGSIAYLEGLYKKGMYELLGEVLTSSTVMTHFLFAFTRKHHSDLSHDIIAGIQYSEKYGAVVIAALGGLVKKVFKLAGAVEPPKKPRSPRNSKKAAVSG